MFELVTKLAAEAKDKSVAKTRSNIAANAALGAAAGGLIPAGVLGATDVGHLGYGKLRSFLDRRAGKKLSKKLEDAIASNADKKIVGELEQNLIKHKLDSGFRAFEHGLGRIVLPEKLKSMAKVGIPAGVVLGAAVGAQRAADKRMRKS